MQYQNNRNIYKWWLSIIMNNLFSQLGATDLTPVQEIDGIYFKRDDLFAPFGAGSVNGGKLRQGAFLLAQAKTQGYERVITGCSLISPQAPMIAAVAQHFGMECCIVYGGTKIEKLQEKYMPRLAKHFEANFYIAKSGRSNVLLHCAKGIAAHSIPYRKSFIVEYGMNSKDPQHLAAFYGSTADQVMNLPDEMDHLIITCGSGITSAGVLYGLKIHQKKVKHVWLIGTAPNREKKVKTRLVDLSFYAGSSLNCYNIQFNYVDLFSKGVTYEKRYSGIKWGDIEFHPHYEAKAFNWFLENMLERHIYAREKVVFWIVGAEPQLLK